MASRTDKHIVTVGPLSAPETAHNTNPI